MSVVLTVIIVVALIALFAIIATWILSHFLGNGVVMPDLPEAEKQATLQGNRSFALNGEFSKVAFNTVKRGYSPAQVDDLLDVLALELQQAKAELEASKRSSNAETAAEAE